MEPLKVIYGFEISPCSSPSSSLGYSSGSSPGNVNYSDYFSEEFGSIKHSMLSIELHHAKPTALSENKNEDIVKPPEIKNKSEVVNYVFGSQPISIRGKRMY